MNTHRLDVIADRLQVLGEALAADGAVRYRYVRRGDWLLPISQILKNPRMAARALVSGTWRQTIELPFQARSMLVKSNLRVFGLPDNTTAKVTLPGKFLFREVRGRHFVSRLNVDFSIPAIKNYNLSEGWLLEEEIAVKHASRDELIAQFLACAPAFYAASARLKTIHGTDMLWPVALGHGDISPGNMMLDQSGMLCLIDWEHAKTHSIAQELRYLYFALPPFREAILALLERFSKGTTKTASPETQMGLALFDAAQKEYRTKQERIDVLKQRGRTQCQAEDEVAQRLKGLIAAAMELAPQLRSPDLGAVGNHGAEREESICVRRCEW